MRRKLFQLRQNHAQLGVGFGFGGVLDTFFVIDVGLKTAAEAGRPFVEEFFAGELDAETEVFFGGSLDGARGKDGERVGGFHLRTLRDGYVIPAQRVDKLIDDDGGDTRHDVNVACQLEGLDVLTDGVGDYLLEVDAVFVAVELVDDEVGGLLVHTKLLDNVVLLDGFDVFEPTAEEVFGEDEGAILDVAGLLDSLAGVEECLNVHA